MITLKRVSIALSVAALLAGCSSGVKLDETAVEDRNPANTTGAASGVAGVDLTDRR
jgi:peptidoglycan-associated lipoprotein